MRVRLAQLIEAIPEISDAKDKKEMEQHAETLRGDIHREEVWEWKQDAIRVTTGQMKCGEG
jgi:hypothetical protein